MELIQIAFISFLLGSTWGDLTDTQVPVAPSPPVGPSAPAPVVGPSSIGGPIITPGITVDPECYCGAVYDPVCGCDGRTYSNMCQLYCATKKYPCLHCIHRGTCDQPKPHMPCEHGNN